MDTDNKDHFQDAKEDNEDSAESKEHLPSQNNDHGEQNDERTGHLINQVFENDILREIIVTKVIENKEPNNSIGSIRLIQKVWAKEVVWIMRKMGKPLYKLELNKDNSLNSSSYVEKHKSKVLEHFISAVALSTSRIENVVPPFGVTIKSNFFQDENRQNFSDFLTGGSVAGLVELEIDIPEKGGSMDLLFSVDKTLSFPILKKLTLRFCEDETTREVDNETAVQVHGSSSYFFPFLQTVLHGAKVITELGLASREIHSDVVNIPTGVRYLTLPTSITTLNLECMLTSSQLEGLLLTTNYLPNLKDLILPMYHVPICTNVLFRVFDQYKKTLRKLDFQGISLCHDDIPKNTTLFRFPVMERLQLFYSTSVHAELEPALHSLQTYLPVLNELWLMSQSAEMFRKWTQNSRFPNVTKLVMTLVDDSVPETRAENVVTFRMQEMQALHMAFPNVITLDIRVIGGETCGLKYMFMEMKQLRELTIRVCRSEQFANSNHWDSLLTGIPVPVAETLRDKPHFWKCVKYIEMKVEESSLRNLNALQSLRLAAPLGRIRDQASLISDSSFHLAFLKMPNLKKLLLEGKFKASPEMTEIWKAENRSIKYDPKVQGW